MQQQIIPFLKWAGGKRWLVPHTADLIPETYERYIEPFIGGGAVFFHLQPQASIISDANAELINTYKAIRDNWKLVVRYLKEHGSRHSDDYYYLIRSARPTSLSARAARMIYLNRTCWNGLYRVNLKGIFNVPRGTKNSVLLDSDDFESTAKMLQRAEIECADFEVSVNRATRGDFVFIDPPYTVKHNFNGFIKYNENLFSWEDQERLRQAIDRAVARGAKILVLNAAHDSIRELYKGYQQIELARKSVLSGNSLYRGVCGELAIKCW